MVSRGCRKGGGGEVLGLVVVWGRLARERRRLGIFRVREGGRGCGKVVGEVARSWVEGVD